MHKIVVAVAAVLLLVPPAASLAAVTESFTGSVDASGTSWRSHSFEVTAVGTIEGILDWDDASADLNLFLKDPSGTIVASSTGAAKPETVSHYAEVTGTWSFGVKAKSGAASYTLSVTHSSGDEPAIVAANYLRTVGGSGHAEMYPSGLDVDEAGNVYVADTGGDRVTAYDGSDALLWDSGGARGKRAPGFFDNPRDVAFLAGNLYVADTGYNRIQVLDAATGDLLEDWSVRFGAIMGISGGVDGSGNPVVLATDGNKHRVSVLSPAGSLLQTVGSGPGSGNGQLTQPRDAATDSAGTIYVADYTNHRIAVFGPDGTWLRNWGVKGEGEGQMKFPYGVDLDGQGRVYVASNNDRIQRFQADGTYDLVTYGQGHFSHVRRVAVGAGTDPLVYGADLWTFKLERYANDGTHQLTFGGVGPPEGLFNEPYGVAVDTRSTFVADTTNQRVQRFDAGGTFELVWGERGWGIDNLTGFGWPRDVTINPKTDKVWLADTRNSRLIEFTRNGVPTGKVHGKWGSSPTDLNWPFGIASYDDDVVLADTKNHRVMRWDPNGGTPVVVWVATGFNQPKDVAVFGDVVYVADSLNKRIVRLQVSDGSMIDTFGEDVLHRVEGVAVEPNGDIWAADTSWNRLVELAPDGSYLQHFGGLGSSHGKFNQPTHLEVLPGSPNLLFVADVWNDRVEVFDVGG